MSIGTKLREQVSVRLADPDKEPVWKWCTENSARNDFDPGVLGYPSTKIIAACDESGPIVYMPVQGAAVLESLGLNPEATPLQIAAALVEAVKGACLLAHAAGMREVYFQASDELTAKGAEKLGFEEVPFRMFRKKL